MINELLDELTVHFDDRIETIRRYQKTVKKNETKDLLKGMVVAFEECNRKIKTLKKVLSL